MSGIREVLERVMPVLLGLVGVEILNQGHENRDCRKKRQVGSKVSFAYLALLSRTNVSYGAL